MKRTELLLLVLAVLCVVAIVVNTVALGKLMGGSEPDSSRTVYCQQYGYLYRGVPDDLNYCQGEVGR